MVCDCLSPHPSAPTLMLLLWRYWSTVRFSLTDSICFPSCPHTALPLHYTGNHKEAHNHGDGTVFSPPPEGRNGRGFVSWGARICSRGWLWPDVFLWKRPAHPNSSTLGWLGFQADPRAPNSEPAVILIHTVSSLPATPGYSSPERCSRREKRFRRFCGCINARESFWLGVFKYQPYQDFLLGMCLVCPAIHFFCSSFWNAQK